jgi:class 3 adenylate cyclase
MVDQYSGAANKNIGEAFLLVWKFQDDDVDLDDETGELVLKKNNRVSAIADMSVVAFSKTICAVKKSYKLAKYSENKEIRALTGQNWRVNMGFGLHVGWAIEGAIGSDFKIDASYLSPNVNMASRLEAATR